MSSPGQVAGFAASVHHLTQGNRTNSFSPLLTPFCILPLYHALSLAHYSCAGWYRVADSDYSIDQLGGILVREWKLLSKQK